MSIFSERLREVRKAKGITQKAAANHLEMTDQAYQKYEYGMREPNLVTCTALANFYDVSMDYLMGRTDDITSINITKRMKILLLDKRINEEAKGLYMYLYSNIPIFNEPISLSHENEYTEWNGLSKIKFEEAVQQLVDFQYVRVENNPAKNSTAKLYHLI